MELKQLEFLIVCAETKSFSKAANVLFTAQSNVSKVIRSLEDELGVELFERKQYGISLTPRGRMIYDYARSTIENAQKIIDFSKQTPKQELRISCNSSSWMAEAFCEYYRESADRHTDYYIMSASTGEIIRRLASDVDQLGFVFLSEEQLNGMQGKLDKNHVSFHVLKKTDKHLYFGNEQALQRYLAEGNEDTEEETEIALVQGGEDELSPGMIHAEQGAGDSNRKKFRVAVRTNSDNVIQSLLKGTDLGNISSGYLPGTDAFASHGISFFEGEEIMFGCLFRNDRNLDGLHVRYLNFIKNRLCEE